MQKFFTAIPLVALLALAAPVGQAQQMPGRDDMHKRFEQMDRTMDEARKSQGAERWRHMHDHMEMMHDQMMAMHGMMGNGMMGGGNMGNGMPGMGMHEGPMGQGPMGRGERGGPRGPGPDRWMHQMQNRMDMMQMMMEQMEKQQQLMLEDHAKP